MSSMLLQSISRSGLTCPVISRDHPNYDRYRKVWNGIADRRPSAIVRPRTISDVQKAVLAAAASGSLLAVRGGGHSLPGISTCDGGLVLDLAALNAVRIDHRAGTVDVGGGALLGDLDRATVPLGCVVPAGVISHTGVGGLTLGGGMGWASRKYGLTIDSLLEAEIVTADGRIVLASATSEPDLFWGIRGGGGNFGVVTRFRFRMNPFAGVTVGNWTYPLAQAKAALLALRDIAALKSRDFAVGFTVTPSRLSLSAVWHGEKGLAEAMLLPVGKLASSGEGGLTGQTYLELQSRNDEHFAWSRRYYAKGGFWREIGNGAIDHMVETIAHAPTPDCEIYVLQLGGAIADIDDDATAYSGRKAGFYWIAEPVWDRVEDDATCLAWGRETAGRLADDSVIGNYVNEQGDAGVSVAISAYGDAKYRRLQQLKSRFDPGNLFRLNQNIQPLA
ncbi:FAD-binding oxidoreductase [Rhizobium sp. TH2]|uniref:FAD-binding oxidoreductase n=1 Tax=Rhizobium sp. TH2 TaxID=2775403 RepID=UPI0021578C3C|nr:FAD-binding oxidoreductase [Rhizobium sp. TH2]UVC10129.1 FAD-binding oxidoreductase [Rhizobium sp. TH2]